MCNTTTNRTGLRRRRKDTADGAVRLAAPRGKAPNPLPKCTLLTWRGCMCPLWTVASALVFAVQQKTPVARFRFRSQNGSHHRTALGKYR
jgi:hypothetical protein